MRYVALLRGINVGGNNKIAMRDLAGLFESLGMTDVRTYINSGNVIFSTAADSHREVTALLESAIEERLGVAVSVLVRDVDEIRSVIAALPGDWMNDESNRCDVLFLWDDVDTPSIMDEIGHDPGLEDVRYTPGAVIRMVSRRNAGRSSLMKVMATPLYRRMTIRNCTTARKLLTLMEE